jgi:transcriptional regulator with XRE-family HTH domain
VDRRTAEILHGAEALPVTRLVCGIRFGLGLLRTAPDIGRQLNSRETPTADPTPTPTAVRVVAVSMTGGGPPSGPTVRRMLVGSRLRRLRLDAGITREKAGEAICASEGKIHRLENGQVGFKERDVVDLLRLYGVSDPGEVAAVLGMALEANDTGWWHRYGDVRPQWYRAYVDLEQAATLIRSYEGQFVPGLLQTDDYMRAVMGGALDEAPEDIERRVEVRLAPPGAAHPTRPSPAMGGDRRGVATPAGGWRPGDARPARAPDRGDRAAERHPPGAPLWGQRAPRP